jgi:hypothetical protein
MFELQLASRVIHDAVPTSPLMRFVLAVIDGTQNHQFVMVVAERVDFDNGLITMGAILKELVAESDNVLMVVGFLAGKFINSVLSKEACKLFFVYSSSQSSFMMPIHLVRFHLPLSCCV